MTVGEKLQEIMDWKGLNQQKLAQLSDISPSMISEYIRDVREPNLEALRKLAIGLDVTPWAIINDEPLAVKDVDLNKQERELIGIYRTLSAKSRKLIETTTNTLSEVEYKWKK